MPNTTSAKKRIRQTLDRTERNKARRSAMRSAIRQVREALESGDRKQAEALLPTAYQAIDKAAGHHVIHANTAAHRKARLARRVARAD